MKGIYKFNRDCGRMGSVESTFIATQKEVDAIIGKYVNFGEILGKHSEIYGKVEDGEITLISSDVVAIKVLENIGLLPTGHNPLDYFKCYCCGDKLDVLEYMLDPEGNQICAMCKKEYYSESVNS